MEEGMLESVELIELILMSFGLPSFPSFPGLAIQLISSPSTLTYKLDLSRNVGARGELYVFG
jgi:hypothetical protein